ncbi:hypothetical protein B4O85_02620 [Pseudomonas azotoformans]|uniref:DUF1534 domain-containing protein n=1 Tax=Pseudomonas azotoformans TaxID=47878 RepID=A0A4Q0HZY6_PSEAZ|nr:hypothetical protein B4O85_02620 [Pseudomonas azotoformans]
MARSSRSWQRATAAPDRQHNDRSHAPRGNAAFDAPRHALGRRASRDAFPRRAWERSASL